MQAAATTSLHGGCPASAYVRASPAQGRRCHRSSGLAARKFCLKCSLNPIPFCFHLSCFQEPQRRSPSLLLHSSPSDTWAVSPSPSHQLCQALSTIPHRTTFHWTSGHAVALLWNSCPWLVRRGFEGVPVAVPEFLVASPAERSGATAPFATHLLSVWGGAVR